MNWHIYSVRILSEVTPQAKHRVLLMSTGGPLGTAIQGYHFTPNSILKIPKFVVDKDKSPLKSTEVVITQMYAPVCIYV